MEEKHIAMCGLECNTCEAFIATKNNNYDLRKKVAKEWTERYKINPPLEPRDINCRGCLSQYGPLYRNCLLCEVRKCGFSRGIKNCKECKDYKCDKLTNLQNNLF